MRSVMPLQAVSFPLPETRFFKADSLIYKFKISGGRSLRREEAVGENLHEELEEIIRAVLGNLDSLQPFSSAHFNVFPYKKPWEGASKVTCTHGERRLRAYPFSLVLYLEKNPQNEGAKQAAENLRPQKDVAKPFHRVSEPPSKRRRRDSPLEEAILKELHEDMEAQGKVSVLGRPSVHCPHAQKQVGEDPGHADKKASTAFDERRQKAAVNTVRGRRTADEVPCGSMRHMGEEEELEQELGSVAETPARPGMLSRLVRGIFPFSLLFRKP